MWFKFMIVLASLDHMMPSAKAKETTTSQTALETLRPSPLSKMYWMPCRELAPTYSIVVLPTASCSQSIFLILKVLLEVSFVS